MKLGMSFGFNAVQAGQKAATVNAEPQLIANSTLGKFVVTSPVTKALSVTPGDNIMFINNISEVEKAIATNNPEVVAWAQEQGINLTTPEGIKATTDAFAIWAITKGVAVVSKGEPVMINERFSKADKEAYIEKYAAEIVAANREALVERVGNPDATDEELAAAITVDDIESPKTQAYTGSRTASNGTATGVGCQLNFTDTNIWTTLKADLDDKTKKNRIFKVLLDNPIQTKVSNGDVLVDVTAYPIEFSEDTDPIVRASK